MITLANLKSESQFSPLMVLLIVVGFTMVLLTIGRKIIDSYFSLLTTKLLEACAELSFSSLVFCLQVFSPSGWHYADLALS